MRRWLSCFVIVALYAAGTLATMQVHRRPMSTAAPVCGDGVRNGSDECDGTDFGPFTCETEAPGTCGSLTCTGSCEVDTVTCGSCVDLLIETFDDAGGGAAPDGYDDADWTETGGDPNQNTAFANCGDAGVGFTDQCVRFEPGSFESWAAVNAIGTQAGAVYLSVLIDATFTFDTDPGTEEHLLVAIAPAGGSQNGFEVRAAHTMPGDTRELTLWTCEAGFCVGLDTAAYTNGSSVCVELFVNNATGAYEWKIGGVSQGAAGTGSITTTDFTSAFLFGEEGGGAETMDVRYDILNVSSFTWPGCP